MSSDHVHMLVGFKEVDMCKISGQDREGLVVDDTLLLQVPLLHLPSPLIGFLLDLFHSFYYDAPLLRRYGQRDSPLAWAADCTVHPFSPLVNSMAHLLLPASKGRSVPLRPFDT